MRRAQSFGRCGQRSRCGRCVVRQTAAGAFAAPLGLRLGRAGRRGVGQKLRLWLRPRHRDRRPVSRQIRPCQSRRRDRAGRFALHRNHAVRRTRMLRLRCCSCASRRCRNSARLEHVAGLAPAGGLAGDHIDAIDRQHNQLAARCAIGQPQCIPCARRSGDIAAASVPVHRQGLARHRDRRSTGRPSAGRGHDLARTTRGEGQQAENGRRHDDASALQAG